jgi:hypothetical protein
VALTGGMNSSFLFDHQMFFAFFEIQQPIPQRAVLAGLNLTWAQVRIVGLQISGSRLSTLNSFDSFFGDIGSNQSSRRDIKGRSPD